MKTKFPLLILIVFGYSIFTQANAQQIVVRWNEARTAGSLSGIVTDKNGGSIPNATVERLGNKWKKKIDSTYTNSEGQFNFPNLPDGTYYLRIIKKGFNHSEVKIKKVVRKSKAKLILELEIST